jgi:phosphoglucomutase
MSGLLIAEYRLSQMREKGILPNNGMLVSTIVSSNLAKAIAKEYNIDFREVLTGFKFIGEQIKIEEQKQDGKKYLFGFEESYGCLISDYARDKDGISAVMSLCEAAAYYKSMGITLWDQMLNIFKKYGYYNEGQVSITLEGSSGAEKIKQMMDNLRNNLPVKIGKYNVLVFKDFLNNIVKDMATGNITETGLPKSNVLYFDLEDDAWCCVRPSGTEPKIKLYFGIKSNSLENAKRDLEELKNAMCEIVK